MKRVRLILIMIFIFSAGATVPLTAADPAADPARQFQQILDYYQLLRHGPEGRERNNWLRTGLALQRLQRAYPAHEAAPQSLYLLGNLYHQLYRRYQNQLDLAEAVTYFQDMQATYPHHHLADDALFYLANIFLHDRQEPDRAAGTLARIVAIYPDGDMTAGAHRQLLTLRSAPTGAGEAPIMADDRARPAEVLPIRHWSSASYTRVVIETSRPLTFRSQMLTNGDGSRRLNLDLAGARLSPRIETEIQATEDGLLRRVSHAQLTADSVRVVLETKAIIDDYKIFSLENPFRVVIDLLGETYPPPPRRPAGEAAPDPERDRLAAPPPFPVEPLSLARQLGLGIRRVVIDPGHGGKDPGAVSPSGVKEKDITLKVAKLLAAALKEYSGSEVILTRDRDIFLPLEERTAIANSRGADLFISIHVNSATTAEARGLETHVLDVVASDDEAMRVAARENASSARSFSELQNIVQELLNNTKLQESLRLANSVQEIMVSDLRRVHGEQILDRGIRRAPFVVLIGAQMPALLVELGFLSNSADERLLTDDRYQERLARSIAAGIGEYAAGLNLAGR